MVYDENPQAQVEKARKADGLLFDYAVAYLQKGDLKGLRSVFERIKKDSPSSSDGWFFEGCYHILLYMAQEDDWDSDIDDDLEFSGVMKEVRASWMRAFKYVEDGDPVEEYFRCVGYSPGHLSVWPSMKI